jgi:hypothetical protein
VKKPKLLDHTRPTDLPTHGPFKEPAADSSTNETSIEPHDHHLSEHRDETPTNVSTTGTLGTSELSIGRLSVDRPLETLDSSGTDDLPTSATHIQIEGDERVDHMSPTTHRAGYDILNEFFGKPGIGLEAVSDIKEHGKWPESTHRDEGPGPANTPEALDAPQHSPSTGTNAVSSKDSDILEPGLLVASATTPESCSRGSSEPGSLSTGSTSCTSSETHIHGEFPSGMYPAYVRRSSLDDPAPWLEHILTALETDDTSRRLDPILGVLDEILTKGDFTLCVRIMTSIAENLREM